MPSRHIPLPHDTSAERLARLEARLQCFEDAEAIRTCVTRYMTLCDSLDAASPLDLLLDCFTEDAVWTGMGARYGASFGAHQGREALGAMFRTYMRTPAHFALNVHFLCNEQVRATGLDQAVAQWVMLQTSTFSSGASHLNAARLNLQMARCADGRWRIARFETENLFSRPVSGWQSESELPVPEPSSPAP
jgi:ketosteroid isomerase-like protein